MKRSKILTTEIPSVPGRRFVGFHSRALIVLHESSKQTPSETCEPTARHRFTLSAGFDQLPGIEDGAARPARRRKLLALRACWSQCFRHTPQEDSSPARAQLNH